MAAPTDSPLEPNTPVEEERPYETIRVFLADVANNRWSALSNAELRMLDSICREVLPALFEEHTLWMANHPQILRRMAELLTEALRAGYRRPTTLDQIVWLRCLLAVHEAMAGRPDRIHDELCLISRDNESEAIPQPNGAFHEQIQDLMRRHEPRTPSLSEVFRAYVAFLRRCRQHAAANELEGRIGRLLGLIARDEIRPGVVRAMLYDLRDKSGQTRFIHATLKRGAEADRTASNDRQIRYTGASRDTIDMAMQEAAICAREAADAYLKRTDYPDGLDERCVLWEITTLHGDSISVGHHYQGGSIAVPVAVAIVSAYVSQAVPNDVAFTGAFNRVTAAEGHIQPVDGVPEKIRHAATNGCGLVYIPARNAAEFEEQPALQSLAAEHNARVVPAESLEQVCSDVFPREGSGRLRDLAADAARNLATVILPQRTSTNASPAPDPHLRHRMHVLACTALTGALVFLEGCMAYLAFAPSFDSLSAWFRISLATIVPLVGLLVAFVLPAACLRHLRVWSWYASAPLLKLCFVAAFLLLLPMLPPTNEISRVFSVAPAAGLMKNMFVIWIFAWALGLNTFNAVASLEHLVERRQFVTSAKCLSWDSPLEARMPLRCVHFPWKWGALGIGMIAIILIILEMVYFATIKGGTAAAYWQIFLGLGRELVFIIAIAEVMVFYKIAVSQIRTRVTAT